MKYRARLFIYLPQIVNFSKYLFQNMHKKAENWHALLHEQYFSECGFLDICRCVFKENATSYKLPLVTCSQYIMLPDHLH